MQKKYLLCDITYSPFNGYLREEGECKKPQAHNFVSSESTLLYLMEVKTVHPIKFRKFCSTYFCLFVSQQMVVLRWTHQNIWIMSNQRAKQYSMKNNFKQKQIWNKGRKMIEQISDIWLPRSSLSSAPMLWQASADWQIFINSSTSKYFWLK